jgi:hypothetical protein
MVVIKLNEPAKDEAPEICKVNMAKSTLAPECPVMLLKGGYKVQPVPAPPSFARAIINN